MSDYFKIEELTFAYQGYGDEEGLPPVIENLSLTLSEGSKTLILGPPDSGKTTLARIVSGLLPRYIEGSLSGELSLNGRSIPNVAPWELLEECTLVAQNPQEQLLMTTCGDEVAFPLESLAIQHPQLGARVDAALEEWGLLEYKEVNPQELSGGERKRLLLAVTEAIGAPLWIMDEPFDDLDERWRQVLREKIKEREGTVILFASRYLDEFDSLFDNHYLLAEGRLDGQEALTKLAKIERGEVVEVGQELLHGEQTLVCNEVEIGHSRRSSDSVTPFTLKVDNFTIKTGEVVALVGPNGSGKSTFSRVLCGLNSPLKGAITLNNRPLGNQERLSRVAYLFQNPDYGIFLPSVKEELGWALRHGEAKKREELVSEGATLFNLALEANPSMMGYGMRKQLQAAVYYILDRPFVIIDEIDSGLTYGDAYKIVSLLKKRGAGVIVITHDRSFASNLASRQYKIVDGEVVESGVGE
ncbi:MAG: ABC transporter ATP-binding protein [Spirochaetales bacterium]|jgi:energy-coupling factor transport system ATP-binding protein|nr:ABC transporter ATP-binding protein [Spirochaetales bacterium]